MANVSNDVGLVPGPVVLVLVVALLACRSAWTAALLGAAGAVVGVRLGAARTRRLPPTAFRLLIAAVEVAAKATPILR
ncbi:hypothetical protein ACFQE5_09835 [Pseudonocardia hispaniensis]|uniref:Uncharacterized protein n=1 Tax=Pseudonocardia hispaniensis TaxID=904933 RepID=A0ABW1J206_9PSEU